MALTKQQQRKLQQARKDGRISGAEAKSLRQLGIPQNQIRKPIKSGASKPAAKPAARKPAPKPAANRPAPKPAANRPAPKPAARKPTPKAATPKRNNQPNRGPTPPSRAANRGPTPPKRSANRGPTRPQRTPVSQQPRSEDPNRNKNKTEPPVLSVKQLNKLQAEIAGKGVIRNTPFSGPPGSGNDVTEGSINYGAYGGKQTKIGSGYKEIGKGKNANIWSKVAAELGIKKVDTAEDVQRLFSYVDNYGTKGKGENQQVAYGGRGSGEYSDIIASLQADIEAGNTAAAGFKDKTIREIAGKWRGEIGMLEGLAGQGSNWGPLAINKKGKDAIGKGKGNNKAGAFDKYWPTQPTSSAFGVPTSTYAPGVSVTGNKGGGGGGGGGGGNGGGGGGGGVGNGANSTGALANAGQVDSGTGEAVYRPDPLDGFYDLLAMQELGTLGMLGDMEAGFLDQIAGLELQIGELGSANDNWAQANAFLEQQLNSANAARADAERRASNMLNAFVPQANPTALSVQYGDARQSQRKGKDNQLSDLSILTGLGTTSNPLAGLQLA